MNRRAFLTALFGAPIAVKAAPVVEKIGRSINCEMPLSAFHLRKGLAAYSIAPIRDTDFRLPIRLTPLDLTKISTGTIDGPLPPGIRSITKKDIAAGTLVFDYQ